MFEVYGAEGVDKEAIEKDLSSILSIIGDNGDFSVHFVSNDEIKELNKVYRDKDEATDILTFTLSDGCEFPVVEESPELGDIFISLESMKRNAEAFCVDAGEELRRLLIHGILHLNGFDHKTNDFTSEPVLIRQEALIDQLDWRILR